MFGWLIVVGSDERPGKRVDSGSAYGGHRPPHQSYYAYAKVDNHSCWDYVFCDAVEPETGGIFLLSADDIQMMALRVWGYRPKYP